MARLSEQSWVLPAVVAAVAAAFTAAVGATITDIGPWYQALKQPDWAPPTWLFGPAWTVIFGLCTISGATAWLRARTRTQAENIIGLFALNGFLNLLWSFLFFRMQRPDLAFYELIVLWLSILALILFCGRFSKLSALLLVPYLVWVTTAGVLNYQVVQLNGPFG
jgi:translocator protein